MEKIGYKVVSVEDGKFLSAYSHRLESLTVEYKIGKATPKNRKLFIFPTIHAARTWMNANKIPNLKIFEASYNEEQITEYIKRRSKSLILGFPCLPFELGSSVTLLHECKILEAF